MFKIEPEFKTVKDVARALKVTPRAVRQSIKRTGSVRGVKVARSSGMILFSQKQYSRIVGI